MKRKSFLEMAKHVKEITPEDEIDAHLPEDYCTWCYQKITSNVHMCDCMECGAPAFHCKHPRPKWWVQ